MALKIEYGIARKFEFEELEKIKNSK